MRFLLDANVPRSVLGEIARHGHDAAHVQDIGLGAASDERIAAHARGQGYVLVTRDLDFADVRAYPPQGTPGRLVLRVPDDWTATRIVALMSTFLARADLVAHLPGRLAMLDPQQVRFRPGLK